MNGYHKLNDDEIADLQKQLILPNVDYSHYQPLMIDDIIVHACMVPEPLTGETFYAKNIQRRTGQKTLYVSNYGRILYNSEIIKPYIVGTFLHCTKVYHKEIGDHYYDKSLQKYIMIIEATSKNT